MTDLTVTDVIDEQVAYMLGVSEYVDTAERLNGRSGLYSNGYMAEDLLPNKDDEANPNIFFKEIVKRFGGEGMGDDTHVVFRVVHPSLGERFVKFQGFYDSWNGTDWHEEAAWVSPHQVTTTEYY